MAGRFLTSCRVSSHEIPPCPTTMAARRTVTGTPASAEQALDLAARAQVGREAAALGAETAEVDDLADARGGCRLAERRGGLRRPSARSRHCRGSARGSRRRRRRRGPARGCRGRGRRPPTAVPGPSYVSGWRVSARTSWPASTSCGVSLRPTNPVAPVTRMWRGGGVTSPDVPIGEPSTPVTGHAWRCWRAGSRPCPPRRPAPARRSTSGFRRSTTSWIRSGETPFSL